MSRIFLLKIYIVTSIIYLMNLHHIKTFRRKNLNSNSNPGLRKKSNIWEREKYFINIVVKKTLYKKGDLFMINTKLCGTT